MKTENTDQLLLKIELLQNRLSEAEELIEAIKAGEVDAFAFNTNSKPEIYTLQSGDYAYRILIEKFEEGALNLSEEGLIVYTNEYFCGLIGVSYEKVLGSNIFNWIDPASIEEFRGLFRQASRGNSKGEINLVVGERALPVYVSLTSLRPTLATVGVIISDLTEKKKNQRVILKYQSDIEALSKSDKLKSDFIKVASHELNTPVTSIKGYIQLLLSALQRSDTNEMMTTQFITTALVKIDKQVLRLVRLISELLDLSRIEGGHLDLHREIFSLNELVTEAVQDIRVTNATKTFNLFFKADCRVKADKDRMLQVFSNLFTNAIKYSPDSMHIDIVVDHADHDRVGISIIDYGIGIDARDHERIFERFYRSEERNEETYPGFGIGLFISKEIMQRHNGNILVESRRGRGSTFTVVLPVYSEIP